MLSVSALEIPLLKLVKSTSKNPLISEKDKSITNTKNPIK
jgi:hypothetical protein